MFKTTTNSPRASLSRSPSRSPSGPASVPLAFALLLFIGACSAGNDPSADGGGSGGQQAACPQGFLPLKTGVKWTYHVRDVTSGNVETKETTVEMLAPVPTNPARMAYRVRTRKGAG